MIVPVARPGPLQDRPARADVLPVLPDPHTPALALEHCPHCRGAVRPGAPWCTQCWADLRPAPEPEPEPLLLAAPTAQAVAPTAAPAVALPVAAAAARTAAAPVPRHAGPADAAEPAWPCTTCGAPNPIELASCAACGAPFLAAVRSGREPLLVLPVVGDVGKLSKGQRYGLAGLVVLAVLLLVALLGVLSS